VLKGRGIEGGGGRGEAGGVEGECCVTLLDEQHAFVINPALMKEEVVGKRTGGAKVGRIYCGHTGKRRNHWGTFEQSCGRGV